MCDTTSLTPPPAPPVVLPPPGLRPRHAGVHGRADQRSAIAPIHPPDGTGTIASLHDIRMSGHATGDDWELAARKHLEAAGLRLLAANQNYRVGEIDLVMRDGDVVVFVEVRYRRSAGFGGSAPSVDANKQRKLVLAAQCFLAAHADLARRACRFDVVAVEGSADAPRVDWIRNAFDAG